MFGKLSVGLSKQQQLGIDSLTVDSSFIISIRVNCSVIQLFFDKNAVLMQQNTVNSRLEIQMNDFQSPIILSKK